MDPSLARLERVLTQFGGDAARAKLALLRRLARVKLPSARAVSRLHETLCFLRAYPDDERVLALVERELARFERRADLKRFAPELEDSGIAGTDIVYPFFAQMALWLASRWPERLRVEWDEVENAEEIESCLHLLAHYAETPFLDEWTYPMRKWCRLLARSGETDAAFLIRRFAALGLDPFVHEWLYQRMGLVLRLSAGPGTPARTRAKRELAPVRFQTAPLDTARPDLRAAIARRDFRVRELSRSEGARWIDVAREALVTRSRDLDAFSYGDPGDVRAIEWDDGLAFVAVGVKPQRRLLLEAVYAFLTVKNGVPIGYVLNSALFGSAEIAYNVFDTYRGGESALIYGRVLAMVARLFGADTFAVYPYQLGDDNEEGLRSGAWWFYQKLGFRAKHAGTLELMERELGRMRRRAGYRSSLETLAQLARENVYYHAGKPREDVIGVLPLSHVGAAVSRHFARHHGSDREGGVRAALERAGTLTSAGSRSDWSASERLAFERWAPLLGILPGIERWSPAEKRDLLAVVRAKGGAREADFVRRFDAHAKLRAAIVRLTRRNPPPD
jgi:hypothetical protein